MNSGRKETDHTHSPNYGTSSDNLLCKEVPGIRLVPTETVDGYCVRPGFFLENGATIVPGGVNFTICSLHATKVELALFHYDEEAPFAVLPFPESCRIGATYSMIVFGLDVGNFEYAYRVEGPEEATPDADRRIADLPAMNTTPDAGRRNADLPSMNTSPEASKHSGFLLDPYAKAVAGRSRWGFLPEGGHVYRARVVADDFDWGAARDRLLPTEDMIIYEMHVRGFTMDPSSGVSSPGTFAGLAEKIPYLLDLGVNAVELMPVFEFDETGGAREVDGKRVLDYWGYNPVGFFAPNTSYNARVNRNGEGTELKELIKALHDHGIEVILDVVFNHTAEGDANGPVISFKGLDNKIYYMLTPEGYYYNFSGCGNTLNCNHPIVQNMILSCLRYWVSQYRVDGFRFDLASILGRNEDGSPMNKPPLLQSLAFDPILADVKLIAEAWDAGGLYQVGSFPSFRRWSEWNGRYRDDLRRFLKGDAGLAYTVAERISGSPDLYHPVLRGTDASVNFLTCHDGFTLYDLYAYNTKHNEANGWNNTDGDNCPNSWNCGAEGVTDDPAVLDLRHRMIRNAAAVLLASRGTPMFLAGDEFGNTQFGNNNAYCQDNEISWLDWTMLEKNRDIFSFFRKMIAFRKAHPVLRRATGAALCGLPSVSYHGVKPWYLDPSPETRVVGVLFAGILEADGAIGRATGTEDDIVYVLTNAHWEAHDVELPALPGSLQWSLAIDTAADSMHDEFLVVERSVTISPRSVAIFSATK